MELETIVAEKSEKLLMKACQFGASDIHLLPTKEQYSILFRKFGKLIQAGTLTDDLGMRIITYFKFLSALDISEKRKPQSGAFAKLLQNLPYSFRVSTLPSVFQKESLVIRILRQNFTLPLHQISYFPTQADELCQLAHQRQGLLLLTGATGSGKTTTLYSLIHYCRTALARHVISLEDPVEIGQEDLLQIQVNERAGITYASGLKAILRHSPDVIMIGEIRDRETAKIAVESSLTGHLVLSTIHAKDTVNCIYRLMDLSISIDEIRQSLIGIVAQDLVPIREDDDRKAVYEILKDLQLFEAITATLRGEMYSMPDNERLPYLMQQALGTCNVE